MTRTEIEAKLSGIENIEALIARINNAEDDEAVLEILKLNGLELTEEEVHSLTLADDELNAEDLDDVAGGCKCKGILKRWVTNVLQWIFKHGAGVEVTCPDCNH